MALGFKLAVSVGQNSRTEYQVQTNMTPAQIYMLLHLIAEDYLHGKVSTAKNIITKLDAKNIDERISNI